ncbi:hypothetical protein [Aeromonas veronii]|uniref:hypothetical protein n=1 Tax=Aeromonas veronii TaxID=654 RepID=UPI001F4362B0|nr:hypothetical protein [Aeromonas veronii]MCF5857689.1 hypothetical protein [Aeromonas veronii]
MSEQKFNALVLAASIRKTLLLAKDTADQPQVIFPMQPGVCHPLRSDRVQRAIRSHAKSKETRLNKHRIEEVLDELDAIAFEEGDVIRPHYRVAPVVGGYLYNLGAGRFFHVTATEGVSVTTTVPEGVYFTESSTMVSTPTPEPRPDLSALLGWFNCSPVEKLLLIGWLTFVVATPKAAQVPYPILTVRAAAGSGKTFMCSKVIRQLVDPSSVASQTMPKTIKDVAISAQNSHLIVYDNLRFIRRELSDDLCKVATGGTVSGRKLYTDGQEYSMDVRCALVLNGIHTFVTESDLVSRCVNITLSPIENDQRQTEAELDAKFERDLPSLIYTLHFLTAKVLAVKDNVEVRYKSRMADFSTWLAGLEKVLNIPHGQLQNAYQHNVEQAKIAGVADDSLFVAMIEFAQRFRGGNPWRGTPHALFEALTSQTSVNPGSDMPRNASAMSRRLPMLQDALASDGVYFKHKRGSERNYEVWFVPKTGKSRDEGDDATNLPVTPTQPSAQVDAHASDVDAAEELLV